MATEIENAIHGTFVDFEQKHKIIRNISY